MISYCDTEEEKLKEFRLAVVLKERMLSMEWYGLEIWCLFTSEKSTNLRVKSIFR